MSNLEPETKLIIDTLADGRFTFSVKFRGEMHPTSRPMTKREDAELLGHVLLKQLERTSLRQRGVAVFPHFSGSQLF